MLKLNEMLENERKKKGLNKKNIAIQIGLNPDYSSIVN